MASCTSAGVSCSSAGSRDSPGGIRWRLRWLQILLMHDRASVPLPDRRPATPQAARLGPSGVSGQRRGLRRVLSRRHPGEYRRLRRLHYFRLAGCSSRTQPMSSTTTHHHDLPLPCCLTLGLYDLITDCGRKSIWPPSGEPNVRQLEPSANG